MVAVRKIRIYPENEQAYRRTIHATRRVYNLTIEALKARDERPQTLLRRTLVNQVVTEFPGVPTVALDEAVNSAYSTRQAIIRKRSKGEKCEYQFRSRKASRQSFTVQKLSKTGMPYPTLLGGAYLTEDVSQRAVGSLADVIYEDGRWFLCAKIIVKTRTTESQGLRVAAVDPGVRTFATVFSFDSLAKIGDNFSRDRIYPLLVKLDGLMSLRKKLENLCPVKRGEWVQWMWDRWNNLQKQINRIKNRVSDLKSDLHRRTADWLTDNFDVILLPTFEVQQMTRKVKRKLRRKTVRSMLSLSHWHFKIFLKWIARKKGKIVVDVNESYTSKTDSRTGEVKDIGGAKSINGLDRDINGARGILLRALTRQLEPEIITTSGVSDVAV